MKLYATPIKESQRRGKTKHTHTREREREAQGRQNDISCNWALITISQFINHE